MYIINNRHEINFCCSNNSTYEYQACAQARFRQEVADVRCKHKTRREDLKKNHIMTQNKPIKVGKGVEKRKDAGALPTKVYSLSISD